MLKKFYSVKEASKILGVSTNTIYKYLDVGSLKGKRFNNRGRFKIPYSEIEPYLSREASDDTAEKTEVAQKDRSNFAFFETLGIPLVGLVVIYILWSFGRSAAVSQPSLISDIGSAVLAYSGRTFSGLGGYISKALPGLSGNQKATTAVQNTASLTQPVSQNDTVKNALLGIDTESKTTDLNYKISDTESRTNDLYANVQVLSSNARNLLGKSKTLTSAELNSETDKMLKFLGSLSDSTDKGTIFAEINWLGENWDFSSIKAGRLAASQVSYLLSTLTSQSLAAFTKPDLGDLDNLVIETDSLLGAIGNTTDTSSDKTLYGGLKGVKALAMVLDAKSGEIDKILGSWDSYTAFEKEDTVKTMLSEILSINTLPKIDEAVFSKPSGQGEDTELKNTLLSIKGVLEANKIHLAQKVGELLMVTWLESSGDVKILVANPSALTSQKAVIKYYLPEGIGKEQVGQIDGGLNLSFDSLRHQYYVEGSPILAAGEIKAIGLKVINNSSLAKVIAPPEPIATPAKQIAPLPETVQVIVSSGQKTAEPISPSLVGQVAGIATFNSPPQNMAILVGVAAIFVSGLVLLVIYLRLMLGRGGKKLLTSVVTGENSILLPEEKLNAESHVPAPSYSHVSFSLPRMEFRAIKKFFSAVRKIPVAVKNGLVALLVSVVSLFSNLLTSIKRFFTSLVTGFAKLIASFITSLKQGFLGIIRAIKTFFVSLISAVREILTVLFSITLFFSKLLTSIKKFFVSVVHAIKKFFVGIASAVRKILLVIKAGLVAILVSIVTFLAKLLISIKKLFISLVKGFAGIIISFIGSLKRGFLAVLHAIKAFFLGILSAIRKLLISIKSGILTILTSIVAFFLRIVTSVKNFIISIVTGVVKLTISVVNSFGRGFRAFKRAINTFFVKITSVVAAFFANIAAAITQIIITIKNAILRMIISVKTFFLKVLSLTLKLVFSIVTGLVNFIAAIVTSLKNGFRAVTHAIARLFADIASAVTKAIISIKKAVLAILASIKTFFLKVLSTTLKLVFSIVTGLVNFITAVITSVKKGINIIINAVITFIANIISAITNAVISVVTAFKKMVISITTLFLKILSKVVRTVAFVIRRLLKILTSIAKFADSNLNQLDFKTPTIRKSRSNFRSTATFLLIGVIYTTILGVLVFKVIPLVKADSQGILGKEAIDPNEEMKIDSRGNENMVLIEVPGGSNVNVRQEATTSSKIIAKIKNTQVVSKIGEEGDWIEIATGPLTGWVSSRLVETSE